MSFFKNFKIKLFFSFVVGLIASLYQMELQGEYEITTKVVMLNQNRPSIYDFLTNVNDYPKWYPNVYSMKQLDTNKQMSVGKRFALNNAYVFAFGQWCHQLKKN
jgi:hypothetical protein